MFSRMRRGWELTKKAWGVIRAHPGLARLPLTGGILAVISAVIFILPGAALLTTESTAAKIGGVVLVAIGAYLASFFVIYFNVALAAAADQALRGEEPDVKAARAVARSRLGVIAQWALVSAVVSVVLSTLRERGGRPATSPPPSAGPSGRSSPSWSCRCWPSRASGPSRR